MLLDSNPSSDLQRILKDTFTEQLPDTLKRELNSLKEQKKQISSADDNEAKNEDYTEKNIINITKSPRKNSIIIEDVDSKLSSRKVKDKI